MSVKPMDSRTVAYLNRQQQLTMNSKAIIEREAYPFKTSASTINQIKDALSAIESPFKSIATLAPAISKSRTSRY